jgi:predicted GIY-YIG superfamily endonuclease
MGLEGGINLYTYTSGRPLRYIDANGKIPIVYPIAVGGAILVGMIWKKMQDHQTGSSGRSGSSDRDDNDEECTLYRILDCEKVTIYIGITSRNPKYRQREHERAPDGKMNIYGCKLCPLKMVPQAVYTNRAACEKAETNQIQAERPFANKRDNPDDPLTRYAKYLEWESKRCKPCQ